MADGHAPFNPWAGVKVPPEPRGRERFLTRGEFDRILAAARQCPERGEETALRYLLLVWTGARKGEAIGIRWRDVDFDAGVIRIRNAEKGASGGRPFRSVPLAPDLRAALEPLRGKPEAAILSAPWNWTRNIQEDFRRAGIEAVRIHDLRHTFGAWMVAAGIPLRDLADLMGHRGSVRVTHLYAHIEPEGSLSRARAAMESASRALAEKAKGG